jgi:HEPN domain-containing protein
MNGPELQSEARRWLRFAQEDLREAERLLASPDSVPRHLCWFAQQAAEKSLKAAQGPDCDYLRAVEGTLSEWASPADEEAYRDL